MIRSPWVRNIAAIGLLLLGAVYLGLRASPVPDLTLVSLRGERFPLRQLHGKVVLVSFWATDCSACVREMPRLIDTYQHYHGRGLELFAVAMSYDRPDFVLNFTEKRGLPFPVVIDVQSTIDRSFGGVNATPTMFVIDKRGDIVHRFLGEPDFQQLHALIDRLLI